MRREFSQQTPSGDLGSAHPYNEPGLSPIQFLYAVMYCSRLPMVTRIEAAKALLPFTEPRPARVPSSDVSCIIRIGGIGPTDHGSASPSGEGTNEKSQSFPPSASNNPQPQSEDQGPSNTEMTSDPDFVPDYSTPPTPAELQEIKAAVNRLRPDLAHLPIPEFHLCPCGHWIAGEYDCCRALSARDPSKMN
jgi:hypothetical protein